MGFIQISQVQGRVPIAVYRLGDRITIGNFAELEHSARTSYDGGMRDLIVDLSEVPALTSIGVRAIVVLHKMLSEKNGKHLKLVCPAAETRDMLDISGVTQYIDIYGNLDEAVASF